MIPTWCNATCASSSLNPGRSANPEAEAFVTVGSQVAVGAVVCLIEAMKIFNEIKAEQAGAIEKILVGNGESVEFGQPLFRLRPV